MSAHSEEAAIILRVSDSLVKHKSRMGINLSARRKKIPVNFELRWKVIRVTSLTDPDSQH